MSLLDDVSIVVTPNGYKAGELYAVVPVPTYGAELVTNGDFATDTDWTINTGWTISGGSANCDGNNQKKIYQNIGLAASKSYEYIIDVKTLTSGTITLFYYNGSYQTIAQNLGLGTHNLRFSTSGTPNGSIYVNSNSFIGSVDNVSVKEYTSADMDVTRATAATRVDENGLVNYAEVVSDTELVTCGNFECAVPLDYWNVNGTATISSGKANINSPSGETAEIYQNNVLEIGKSYTLICDLDKTSGDTQFVNGGTFILANGSNNIFFTATQTRVFFKRGAGSVISSIDNVSVKQVDRDNVPRIDYTGGGCPHILAEPMRTNLVTYSEDFSQTKWTGSPTTADVTVTTNTNPSGASGTYSVENVTGTQLGSFYTITSGVDYTNSFYVRNISGSGVISLKDINNSGTAFTATSEWQKFSVTGTSNSTTGRIYLSVTTLGDIVEVWGAQLEVGSYPTSYIPTSGSTVTRNQDIFTRDGIGSLINSTEGVLFAEIAALSDDGTYRYMGLTDGTDDNRVIILYYTSSTRIRVLISSGGTKYFDEYYGVTSILDFHKVAVKFKENDFALWIDGVERVTVTSGLTPIGLNTLALDQAGGSIMFAKVKQLQVFKTADIDLAALTS